MSASKLMPSLTSNIHSIVKPFTYYIMFASLHFALPSPGRAGAPRFDMILFFSTVADDRDPRLCGIVKILRSNFCLQVNLDES